MRTDRIEGRRFGLLADTHDALVDWPAALTTIRAALGAVDGIIHCGDLTTASALETLARIAPVWAVRSAGDPLEAAPTLIDGSRVLEVDDVRIGVVCSLAASPIEAQTDPTVRFGRVAGADVAQRLFGGAVDVCCFGGTHRAETLASGGTLFVNPGSPTLAKQRSVAVLTIDVGTVAVETLRIC
jgi:putative phosphoesterase